jgi:hypothetical protein
MWALVVGIMKYKKTCKCDWHKEYKFLQSLQVKLTPKEYQTLTKYFEDKWMGEEELTVAKAKLDKTWPGYKYGKPIYDMYKMGWIDNLTYVELAAKARNV